MTTREMRLARRVTQHQQARFEAQRTAGRVPPSLYYIVGAVVVIGLMWWAEQ